MATSLKVNVKVAQVKELADAIGKVASAEVLEQAEVRAVNRVVDRTYNHARQRMNEGINLDDAYIQRRLRVTPATDRPRAAITADGSNVVLGRYNPKLRLRPARNAGRSKGNAKRGIPPGLAAAGVTVEVTRGAPKTIDNAFLMPLRRGSESGGNGLGVFMRDPRGNVSHRYGPSVYQLFRTTVDKMIEEVQDDLQETVLAEVDAAIRKVLP